LASKVEFPSIVGLFVCAAAALESDLVLSSDGLAVKDEEWCHTVLCPLVQIQLNMLVYASQATQRREKRLQNHRVEEGLEIVGCVDRNSAVFKLGNRMIPGERI
jgi:hypothetical protein